MLFSWRHPSANRKPRASRQRARARNRFRSYHPSVERLEERLLLASIHDPFVAQLYRDLLQREAAAVELAPWSGLLDQAGNRGTVAGYIAASPEYQSLVIKGLYDTVLHRAADPAGLGGFGAILQQGGTAEQVAAQLAGSAEYLQQRGGGTNDGFLAALYQDLLGRPIDAAGQSAFSQALAQGTSRTQVAAALVSSTEYRQNLVNGVYQRELHRPADSGGLNGFVAALQKGARDEDIVAIIAGSVEYYTSRVDVRGTPSQLFVAQLYPDLLGRPVDDGGRASWTSFLDQGGARTDVVRGIVSSAEYRRFVVQGLYQTVLHRVADAGGLGGFVAFINLGGTPEQVAVQLAGSLEYFQQRGGGSNDGFLTALYQDMLGRPIDAAGQGGLSQALANGTSRTQVAAAVLASQEFQQHLVGGLYAHFLHRTADSGGLAQFVAALQKGTPDEQVIAAITGSLEYFSRLARPVNTSPPVIVIASPANGGVTNQNITVTGQVTDAGTGVALLQAGVDKGSFANVAFDASGNFSFTTSLALDGSADGAHTVHFQAKNGAGTLSSIVNVTFALNTKPGAVPAPGLDQTVTTTVAAASQFLYTGPNPLQTGVAANTINPVRAAVLRGKVTDPNSAVLAGVTITIMNHPEFGSAQSRADGMFVMVVNGGGLLTVNYVRDGFLPVQRQIDVPWQDYARLPNVVLVPLDTQVSAIDLTSSAPVQVARGSSVTDADGTRQATLFFAQGTHATLTFADGSTKPANTLHVRATESSVGPNGRSALPGNLPARMAYTYALETTADEALAAGATGVKFDHPVSLYLENFIGLPVGLSVPSGFYDRSKGEWNAMSNGRILKILSVTNGEADLDLDGTGKPADASNLAGLGITDAERKQLANLYQAGQILWRTQLVHFSGEDLCGFTAPPPGAGPPDQQNPQNNPPLTCDDQTQGSIIDIQNQTLGEQANVAGTPFSLNYRSGRAPGQTAAYTVQVFLSGASLPAPLKRIDLNVAIAGEEFTQSFPTTPNQSTFFTWDGKDGFGRTVQGAQLATVRISYVYQGLYAGSGATDPTFGGVPGVIVSDSHRAGEAYLSREYRVLLGTLHPVGEVGAWSLDVHHTYDPIGHVLYLGDGSFRGISARTPVIDRYANLGGNIAIGPDGSLYVSEATDYSAVVRRVAPDHTITTVAGTGTPGFAGDGGPALQARFASPRGLAVAPDGSLYVADYGNNRVRRVGPEGIITTVAGNGTLGSNGDGGPATQAALANPIAAARAADGSLYVAEANGGNPGLIRRVSPEGIITTVAGTLVNGSTADGVPATNAFLPGIQALALGSDGSIYISVYNYNLVRRVRPDGIITTVAGGGKPATGIGDGGQATQAVLSGPESIALGPEGTLYIADSFHALRVVGTDGIITTFAGGGRGGDGGPATQAALIPQGVAVGPDGSVYVTGTDGIVHRVHQPLPGFNTADIAVASDDGRELYRFTPSGRHLQTLDTLTGAVLYTFGYDAAGRLMSVTDGDKNVTTIQRDSNGDPAAIVAPFGQVTKLSVDANGYLASITDPAGGNNQYTYSSAGLMQTFTDLGGVHTFSYDSLGRLTKDQDPAGGFSSLGRADTPKGFQVTLTTAENRVSTYLVENLPNGDQHRINTGTDGLVTDDLIRTDGSETVTYPDGLVETTVFGPDPRWGMQAPVLSSDSVKTPGGVTSVFREQRTAALADAANPLSLNTLTDTLTLNGNSFVETYDASSRTLTYKSAEGRSSVSTLDTLGRLVRNQIANLQSLHLTFDSHGFLTVIGRGSGPTDRTDTFTYDAQGNVASLTTPLPFTSKFGHDPAGRQSSFTLPGGQQTAELYYADGNLKSLTPPGRPAHSFTYTPAGRLHTATPPDVGSGPTTTTYDYNLDGQLVRITQPDTKQLTIDYDSAGRTKTITHPGGQLVYAYDPKTGNLQSVTAPDGGKLGYSWDGGLQTGFTWTGAVQGQVNQTYNNNFNVATQSVNGGPAVQFQYDRDGLLKQAGSLMLNNDPATGLLNGTTLASVTTSNQYDTFGAPAGSSATFNGAPLYGTQYTPDANGRLIKTVETIGGTTNTFEYGYDSNGQLQQVRKNGTVVSSYSYDDNGNRTTVTDQNGTLTASHDAQDRLRQFGGNTYTYSANGSLASKTSGGQTATYSYDLLGNLTSVVLPDGTHLDYVIDGAGRRIGKRVNGTLVQAVLYDDLSRPVAQLDANNNLVSQFIYGSDRSTPDYTIRGGKTYRILSDYLGSPRLVVDVATGAVAQRLDYDAWGNLIQDTNPGFQPFGFAGGLYDGQTKLVRFRARDYDAQTGRWTTTEPKGFRPGTNLYMYAYNSPVTVSDPTGMAPPASGGPFSGRPPITENPDGPEENPIHDDPFERPTDKIPEKDVPTDRIRIPRRPRCPKTRTSNRTPSRRELKDVNYGPETFPLEVLIPLLILIPVVVAPEVFIPIVVYAGPELVLAL